MPYLRGFGKSQCLVSPLYAFADWATLSALNFTMDKKLLLLRLSERSTVILVFLIFTSMLLPLSAPCIHTHNCPFWTEKWNAKKPNYFDIIPFYWFPSLLPLIPWTWRKATTIVWLCPRDFYCEERWFLRSSRVETDIFVCAFSRRKKILVCRKGFLGFHCWAASLNALLIFIVIVREKKLISLSFYTQHKSYYFQRKAKQKEGKI